MFAIIDTEKKPIVKCLSLTAEDILNYTDIENYCVPVIPVKGKYFALYENAIETHTSVIYCPVINSKTHILEVIDTELHNDFYERAIAIKEYLNLLPITQTELSSKLCCTQGAISNKIRILKMDSDLLKYCLENGLTERHLREVLRVKQCFRQDVVEEIIASNLSVIGTTKLINEFLKNPTEEYFMNIKISRLRERINRDYEEYVQYMISDSKRFNSKTINYTLDILEEYAHEYAVVTDMYRYLEEEIEELYVQYTENKSKDAKAILRMLTNMETNIYDVLVDKVAVECRTYSFDACLQPALKMLKEQYEAEEKLLVVKRPKIVINNKSYQTLKEACADLNLKYVNVCAYKRNHKATNLEALQYYLTR